MVELPKLSTGEIIGGAAAIGGIAALGITAAVIHHRKKVRKRKHKAKSVRSRVHRGRKLKFGSAAYRKKYLKHGRRKTRRRQRKPYTAGKRRDTSHRRIRYTKNNQPYIIMASGKARFISKRSVSSSRKREGGKY